MQNHYIQVTWAQTNTIETMMQNNRRTCTRKAKQKFKSSDNTRSGYKKSNIYSPTIWEMRNKVFILPIEKPYPPLRHSFFALDIQETMFCFHIFCFCSKTEFTYITTVKAKYMP